MLTLSLVPTTYAFDQKKETMILDLNFEDRLEASGFSIYGLGQARFNQSYIIVQSYFLVISEEGDKFQGLYPMSTHNICFEQKFLGEKA